MADSTELQMWLEWAGARLIAMPGPRIKPAEPRVIWPDYSQETFQVLEFRGAPPIRAGAPLNLEIPMVDTILLLPNICERTIVRNILHARLLMHPIKGTHIYTWVRIAKRLGAKTYTIKSLHEKGLKEILIKTPTSQIEFIGNFFRERQTSVCTNDALALPSRHLA